MMEFLLVAATVVSAQLPQDTRNLISGAEHAIRVDRLEQARLMIERAVAAGASGTELDQAQADLDFANGRNGDALTRYRALLKLAPSNQSLLEPAGIAAVNLGDYDLAFSLLSRATSFPNASWRAWNALGVVADFRFDWPLADHCYVKASNLAPNAAAPVANRGWSLLLRGKWQEALALLETAAALDPKSMRITDDLELARAALAADLPDRHPGESASSWAARLNDAGIAAEILGDQKRAAAAFTQALQASDTWYTRAANNLQALGSR